MSLMKSLRYTMRIIKSKLTKNNPTETFIYTSLLFHLQ